MIPYIWDPCKIWPLPVACSDLSWQHLGLLGYWFSFSSTRKLTIHLSQLCLPRSLLSCVPCCSFPMDLSNLGFYVHSSVFIIQGWGQCPFYTSARAQPLAWCMRCGRLWTNISWMNEWLAVRRIDLRRPTVGCGLRAAWRRWHSEVVSPRAADQPPWPSHFNSVTLSFSIWKMGVMRPNSQLLCRYSFHHHSNLKKALLSAFFLL